MANRTFSFTKEDEKLIAALRKRLAAVYGKIPIIAVIRYALIETERHK